MLSRSFTRPLLRTQASALLWLFTLLVSGSVAQSQQELTLEEIFSGNAYQSQRFSGRWLPHEDAYVLLEDDPQRKGAKRLVRVEASDGSRTVLVAGARFAPHDEAAPIAIDDYTLSPTGAYLLIYTNSQRVWRTKSRGDYWILDCTTHKLHQVAAGFPAATTQFAKFSPDSRLVGYVHDGNVYVEDVRGGAPRQLTKRPTPQFINGTFDWVYEEEFSLRDGFRFSPDSQQIAYWQLDTTGVPVFTMINNTDTLYPRLIRFAHPKTGQQNSGCRVGVVSVDGGSTTWVPLPGDDREHYIARIHWAQHPQQLFIQQLNRQQNKLRLFAAGLKGPAATVFEETDSAWIAVHDELFFGQDHQTFSWLSESSGYRKIELRDREGTVRRRLPQGDFDVIRLLDFDAERQQLTFLASPDQATEQYLYQCGFDGNAKRITPADAAGWHDYALSSSGKYAVHTASRAGAPPRTDLVTLPNHQKVRTLERNARLRTQLAKLPSSEVEFFQVALDPELTFDAWIMHPPNFDQTSARSGHKSYPLLVYVYGEPAGATVTNRWGGSGYLWHRYMAEQGFVVLSIDNRGTKVPKGRAWRKSIYRQVGIMAPEDQARALKQILADRPYLDAQRIGIWGWSGGGSMSLNAIFKYPDLYHTAVSVAPVPNQRYYDTIYQERYMDLPQHNPKGYFDGSPINFAHQLEGNLLLIHGTGDDNCHYQTMEMLINELVEHDKPFSMMAYPNRTHSIREGKNTSLHLRKLMSRYLSEHLLPAKKGEP